MVSRETSRVRSLFEGEAQFWKHVYESPGIEGAIYQTRQQKLLDLISGFQPPDGARVLELGCGAGWLSAALAARGFRVTGSDMVEEMLRLTRENAGAQGLMVETACSDAEALPFRDGSFDIVVGVAILEWLESCDLMLKEAGRVLKPGGFAVLTATNRWGLNRLIDPVLQPWFEPIKRAMRPAYLPRTHSRREIARSLTAAGLRPVGQLTAGFGPFTLFKRKLLPGPAGAELHRKMQRWADAGPPASQGAGYALIVAALKSEQ